MTEPFSRQQPQPQEPTDGQVAYHGWGMPRRVHVKGMQGIDATVLVTVVRGAVWMSISPPFTWEAVMEPETVEEVIRALELARGDALSMAATFCSRPLRNGETTIREIPSGPVAR